MSVQFYFHIKPFAFYSSSDIIYVAEDLAGNGRVWYITWQKSDPTSAINITSSGLKCLEGTC